MFWTLDEVVQAQGTLYLLCPLFLTSSMFAVSTVLFVLAVLPLCLLAVS